MKYDGAVLKIFSNDYQMLYKKSSTRKTEHEVINQQWQEAKSSTVFFFFGFSFNNNQIFSLRSDDQVS